MNHKKIIDIVDDNFISASVLFYFGIEFYDYSEMTLEQACIQRGLKVDTVIKKLESIHEDNSCDISLRDYPIDLIIEYLKHTHFIFIKQKLPYLAKLINNFNACHEDYDCIEKDLKFVFPLFVEDFIHHIYDEEDTLFSYILTLLKFQNEGRNLSEVYYQMEVNSIQKYAVEHGEVDDDMKGIRKITDNYRMDDQVPLHVKVIYAELQALETGLITHAKVENEILFPKALMLEKEIKQKIKTNITLN